MVRNRHHRDPYRSEPDAIGIQLAQSLKQTGGGFDNVAWITPFAVFFLATIGTAVVVRVWKLRNVPAPALTTAGISDPAADAMRERIRRETKY